MTCMESQLKKWLPEVLMPCQKYSCLLKFARSTHANIYSYLEFARMTHAEKNCQKYLFLARSTHAINETEQ